MKWIVVIILALYALNVFSQAERKFVRRGNRQYEDKKFSEAEIQYRKALEKSPGSVAADYNLGNSLYRQNQYDAAALRYKELSGKPTDNKTMNSDYYNLGNALYKAGKYQESIDAYKNALRKMPGDMDAKHNLQLAMKKLEMEQQKNKENKDKQDKQDDKKDNKGDEKQQENQDNKNQSGEKKDQQQDKMGQISAQDAERILQALENEEKNVLKKVQEQQKQVRKVPVEKNW